ncbi:Hypothetical protein NTJ_05019 [Nesidiocoris tenuis]|uniref:Uncharacterized protein n=1 Tax=Nesidiocoris tenuis TaxID=355587 RepID=A0ABN7AIX2_9HEMI|nr:Hypothetical protein NTJ_05019 [Nesidiocoris tenuis]
MVCCDRLPGRDDISGREKRLVRKSEQTRRTDPSIEARPDSRHRSADRNRSPAPVRSSRSSSHPNIEQVSRCSHRSDSLADRGLPKGLDPEPTNQIVGNNGGPEIGQKSSSPISVDVPEDILALLGEVPEPDPLSPFSLHPALVPRWRHVLSHGTSTTEFKELLDKYDLPNNLDLLSPPVLNPELKSVITLSTLNIDKILINRQTILGKSLSALGKGINALLSDKACTGLPSDVRQPLLSSLFDSGKMLTSLFHKISCSRKAGISMHLNESVRDLTKDSPVSTSLFPDLTELIKTAKNIETAGKELKDTRPQPPKNRRQTTALSNRPTLAANRQHLNFPRPGRLSRETGRPKGQTSKPRVPVRSGRVQRTSYQPRRQRR